MAIDGRLENKGEGKVEGLSLSGDTKRIISDVLFLNGNLDKASKKPYKKWWDFFKNLNGVQSNGRSLIIDRF